MKDAYFNVFSGLSSGPAKSVQIVDISTIDLNLLTMLRSRNLLAMPYAGN
jgi:hypothetical protein